MPELKAFLVTLPTAMYRLGAVLPMASPRKLAKPVPKMARARPVTFWLARRVMVSTL